MKRISIAVSIAFSLALGLLAPAYGISRSQIMTPDELRPGMKGKAKSVFKGTTIEEFDVTILGVLEKWDYDFDAILIRVESGTVVRENTGIVAGMSGSPVYVNGKLIGAIAFAWTFSKEPIAGVTPITAMLEDFDPKNAPVKSKSRKVGKLLPKHGPIRIGRKRFDKVLIAEDPRLAPQLQAQDPKSIVLTPIATPLMVSGLNRHALEYLEKVLEPFNVMVVQGPGGSGKKFSAKLEPGSVLGVQLASGDVDISGVGTVTHVEGNKVIGFGHPMFQMGDVEVPITDGYVYGVLSRASISFKLAVSGQPKGVLTQDRNFMVGGFTGRKAPMLPLNMALDDLDRGVAKRYKVNVIYNKLLTNELIYISLLGAMFANSPPMQESTTRMKLKVEAAGLPPIVRENLFVSEGGGGLFSIFFGGGGASSPLADLAQIVESITQNRFKEVKLKNVSVDLRVSKGVRALWIDKVFARKTRVKPGESVPVVLKLRSKERDEERTMNVDLLIPENIRPGRLRVVIGGGMLGELLRNAVGGQLPRPRNVLHIVETLDKRYRNDELVALSTALTGGVEVDGKRLENLPAPTVEALFSLGTSEVQPIRDYLEKRIPTDWVIRGAAVLGVTVESEEKEKEGAAPIPFPQEPGGGFPMPPGGGGGGVPTLFQEWEEDWMQARPMISSAHRFGEWARQVVLLAREHARRLFEPHLQMTNDQFPMTNEQGGGGVGNWSLDIGHLDEPFFAQAQQPTQTPKQPNTQPVQSQEEKNQPLDKDTPPSMPDWNELRQMEIGKIKKPEKGAPPQRPSSSIRTKALARPPSVWVLASAADFMGTQDRRGKFEETVLTSKGEIILGVKGQPLYTPQELCTWAVAADGKGNVYVGTWKPARVRRISEGKSEVLCEVDDVGVLSIALDASGKVYLATTPGGAIYRGADGQALRVCKLEEPYPWAMVAGKDGSLYVGTGPNGKVFRVSPQGEAKLLFKAPDRHALTLALDDQDNLYVGTSPKGRVYKVAPDGSVTPVLELANTTVQSLALDKKGNLYVGTSPQGFIYLVRPDGEVRELQKFTERHVLAMVPGGDESVYASVGPTGKIYHVSADGTATRIFDSEQPFIVSLASDGDGSLTAVMTGTGEVIKLDGSRKEVGTYLSPVKEVEAMAKWGQIRWFAETPGGSRIVLQTRTGNTAYPDSSWSDWSAPYAIDTGQPIQSPPGRYIQFKATLYAGQNGEAPKLKRVEIYYLPKNRRPTLTLNEPKAGAIVSQKVTFRWQASDPDKDQLITEVLYSSDGGKSWKGINGVPAQAQPSPPPSPPAGSPPQSSPQQEKKDGDSTTTGTSIVWDTTKVSDGIYIVKVVASDRLANPKEPMQDEQILDPIIVDNTDPVILWGRRTDQLFSEPPETVLCYDKTYVASAEYRVDNGEWVAAAAADGVFDSPYEDVEIDRSKLPKGRHTLELRIRDAAGNEVSDKIQYDWTEKPEPPMRAQK